ncbi:hypothetical protein chiPu_0025324 [Chiloscyllium punctatum]|uniref:Uncharacterized protein n=1 Tax=Chiloscyllium punctatum TaxID=137246 RepID=A0A401TET0_CHIPU|nr:hypothetical protein [Chiloscyllium punctatum]
MVHLALDPFFRLAFPWPPGAVLASVSLPVSESVSVISMVMRIRGVPAGSRPPGARGQADRYFLSRFDSESLAFFSLAALPLLLWSRVA